MRQIWRVEVAYPTIAVFSPILLIRFSRLQPSGSIFIILKQFGTGIIISTAFVHVSPYTCLCYLTLKANPCDTKLLTHAQLMFANECLGELAYEGVTSAIVLAGAFLAFLLQYTSMRLYDARSRYVAGDVAHSQEVNSEGSDKSSQLQQSTKQHHQIPVRREDTISVLTLEMGIIFHSIRTYFHFSPPIPSFLLLPSSQSSPNSNRHHPRRLRRLLLRNPLHRNSLPPNVRRPRPRRPARQSPLLPVPRPKFPLYPLPIQNPAGLRLRNDYAPRHGHWHRRA